MHAGQVRHVNFLVTEINAPYSTRLILQDFLLTSREVDGVIYVHDVYLITLEND